MWIIVNRTPRPDAPHWPGRRWLAAIDAVGWPVLIVWLVLHAPVHMGAMGQLAIVIAALSALTRLRRAVWFNHRYRFTTWRWGRVVATLVLIGALLKLAA
jgi:hypothetical protein